MRQSSRILSGTASKHVWTIPKAQADRIAASAQLGILAASCGLKASAPELYVREQLTFKVCSMWCLSIFFFFFLERMGLGWRGKRKRLHLVQCPAHYYTSVLETYNAFQLGCSFTVIDQSGSCKFTANGFISCTDESKACASVFVMAHPNFLKRKKKKKRNKTFT